MVLFSLSSKTDRLKRMFGPESPHREPLSHQALRPHQMRPKLACPSSGRGCVGRRPSDGRFFVSDLRRQQQVMFKSDGSSLRSLSGLHSMLHRVIGTYMYWPPICYDPVGHSSMIGVSFRVVGGINCARGLIIVELEKIIIKYRVRNFLPRNL